MITCSTFKRHLQEELNNTKNKQKNNLKYSTALYYQYHNTI